MHKLTMSKCDIVLSDNIQKKHWVYISSMHYNNESILYIYAQVMHAIYVEQLTGWVEDCMGEGCQLAPPVLTAVVGGFH